MQPLSNSLSLVNLTYDIQTLFDKMLAHHEAVQRLLKKSKENLEKNPKEALVNSTNYNIFGVNFSKPSQFDSVFPNIESTALFLATYSIFEDILKKICKVLVNKKCNSTNVDKWFTGVLQKSKDLFIELNVFSETEILKEYEIIDYLRIIRNSMAHCNGYLLNNDREHSMLLEKITSKFDILSHIDVKEIEENHILTITQSFFNYALIKLRDYLAFLHNAVYDK